MGNIKYFKITINKKIIKQKEATNNQVVNSGCNEKDRSEVGKAVGHRVGWTRPGKPMSRAVRARPTIAT